jgi:hypothetical protein
MKDELNTEPLGLITSRAGMLRLRRCGLVNLPIRRRLTPPT